MDRSGDVIGHVEETVTELRTASSATRRSRRVVRRRPSRIFFLTVNVKPVETGTICKRFVLDLFFGLISYCISVERSNNENYVYHIHAFLKFEERLYIGELNEYLRSCMESDFDLQACRSERNCLKYVSKEDVDCLTNVRPSLLSFNYRLHDYCRNFKEFSVNHYFVVEHWNKYKFIERYHLEYYEKKDQQRYGEILLMPVGDAFDNWTLEICNWWNNFIATPFYYKKLHMFVYGPPGTGKSSFVRRLINYLPSNYIFQPSYGQFGFQSFNSRYKCVLIDEFNEKLFDMYLLNMFLEGQLFSTPVKCSVNKRIQCKVPVIILSNFELQNVATKERVLQVSAFSPFWLDEEVSVSKVSPSLDILELNSSDDELVLQADPAQPTAL